MPRKIALITGASRGLGKNTAQHLAAQGIDIIGTYNSKAEQAQALVKTLEASGVRAAMLQLDVSNSASFEAFAQQLSTTLHQVLGRQQLDFLVNNAGIGINAPFSETSEAQFEQLFNIQLKGPVFLTQRPAGRYRRRGCPVAGRWRRLDYRPAPGSVRRHVPLSAQRLMQLRQRRQLQGLGRKAQAYPASQCRAWARAPVQPGVTINQ